MPTRFNTSSLTDPEEYLGGDGDITKALLVPEVFEGGDHVGLEVVPPEAKLLSITGSHLDGSLG